MNAILDVETDVVTRHTFSKLLVVHFNGFDFGSHACGCESNDHASLNNTSFNTTNGHCSDTTDLVDILERKTKGFVGRTNRGLDGINGIEEGLSLDDTALGLLGPALVPGHTISAL